MAEPAHKASTEHPAEGGHGAFPPFQSQTFASQLVWLAIAFVLLYALMSKLALPRVAAIIENRQKRIAGDLAEAEQLKQQSNAAVAAYEKALADARARAQTIANETRATQQAQADASRKTLENGLNARLADAEKSIAATKQAAMANVRTIAEDAA
ncbi:MAG TPA: F0F1 ATP synthase subunit B', partial [Pseudolabrys sp.]